ncbi:MCP four helix bundle domain-containing protein [Flavobacterium aquatile]|uniref:Chemotaxis methyl-accepting receptor HlyB-like 4HB MCP domain-containing protein n=1 Tax=Flavobacterium aquatile LMG 4008 = ATCC 11947 TaxID=1453498 RepID=A0A095STA1_9FLAO|nr:MCP four helix bundle domain-containing protein [Flavobacterium aquatile]KGD67817.1 hypothetical protein LG45_11915 [Flavobacterium aquatile LMG 4008 = ATCC 11947]OXA67678.1 hypothetical protein B0A61_07650 [Flavobacterium aquatile LMG 4008 = ATCC 11947]
MKWTNNIKNKSLASIILLSLCLLVLLNNYLERVHATNVKDAISTLYEDRLIAEEYILKMTSTIYQVREVLASDSNSNSKSNAIKTLNDNFNATYSAYSKTKLTPKEKTTAVELLNYINKFESTFSTNNYSPSLYTNKALTTLSKLSKIQLEESKLIMKNVESQYATIKASSQYAFAIIILILIVLQIIVFSAESIIPVIKTKDPSLN